MLTVNGIDITGAATAAEIDERVNSGAAVLRFSVLKSEAHKFESGGKVIFSKGGRTIFAGRIFSKSILPDTAEIAAFDSVADLKTVLPVKRNAGRADSFVKEIFALTEDHVKTGEIDSCSTELAPNQYKNLSLLNILYRVADEVKESSGIFVLRDEAGVIAFRNENSLKCGYILDGKSVVGFDYKHSVDDAYNYVRLISNNSQMAYTDTAVAKNDEAIQKWGIRSFTKKVYEKNPQQLIASAMALLAEKCKEKESLTVTALGDPEVRAGCLIWCGIDGIGQFWARVLAAHHSFDGKSYFMRLELERI